jgi:hypothetical protein
MGLAWIDLVSGADGEAMLADLRAGAVLLPQLSKGFALEADAVAVALSNGRYRIETCSGGNYGQIADLVVWLAEHTGLVSHAFIALDHDEYGAEHIVIDGRQGMIRRVYHYFAYPRDEDSGSHYTEAEPILATLPGIEHPLAEHDPGVLVDGPASRATIAARYGVPVAAVDQAAAADALAHEQIGIVGAHCAHWRGALGLAWPGESR